MNKLGFARIIGEAARFSLLDRDAATQTLGVHRLVQIVIKAGMSKEDQRNWAERTVRATEKALPYPQSNWALCQKLISHAQTCATLIRGWNFGFVEAATLLNKATACIAARALFDEAEPRRPNLLPVNEKAQGTERPDFGRTLYDLAELYNNQRKYEKAEPLVQQSLRHDPDSRSLNNRPDLDENQLKYVESESLVQRSLAFYDMLLNLGDTDVAFVLNEFASLYYNQGKYGEAEPMYKRSLVIREKALGPNHHAVATALNNLGLTYYNQGKHAEAEPLFQRALAIYENTLGPDHINVATSLNNLAFLYDGQGGYTEAKPLYERSLAIKEKTLGPDHPSTKLTRSHLDALRKRRTAGEE